MPIIDAYGRRIDADELRVPKGDLDPFGAKKQALRLAKSRISPPRSPNARTIEFSVEERKDHYLVRAQAKRDQAGPSTIAERRRDEASKGAGDKSRRDKREELSTMATGASTTESDLQMGQAPVMRGSTAAASQLGSQLDALYSVPELRSAARQNGVLVPNSGDKRDLINALEREAPLVARRLAGR